MNAIVCYVWTSLILPGYCWYIIIVSNIYVGENSRLSVDIRLTSAEWCVSIHFDRSTVIIHFEAVGDLQPSVKFTRLIFTWIKSRHHCTSIDNIIASVADQFLYVNLRFTMQCSIWFLYCRLLMKTEWIEVFLIEFSFWDIFIGEILHHSNNAVFTCICILRCWHFIVMRFASVPYTLFCTKWTGHRDYFVE